MQGYNPSVFYPKRTNKGLYHNLTKQCQKMDIPFLSFLPEPQLVFTAYNAIIDAVFGFSFKGPMRSEFETVVETMISSKLPIVSIDVPSGITSDCYLNDMNVFIDVWIIYHILSQ